MNTCLSNKCKEAIKIIYMDRDQNRYREAIQLLEEGVREKDSDAIYFLARVNSWNEANVDGDDNVALELYRTGAKMGNARCILGADRTCQLDLFIEELTMSFEEAVNQVQQLAEAGDGMAAYELGCAYYYGDIAVREDLMHPEAYYQQMAVKWFEVAADQGIMNGMLNLSRCYRNGEGCEQNLDKGREYMIKAAEKGDVESQFLLGCIYSRDGEVKKDIGIALEWFRKAEAQNHFESRKKIACIYFDNNSGYVDYTKAREIFEELAFQNSDADAYGYLSNIYRDGMGVEIDMNKAHDYCEKGAKLGDEWCQKDLARYKKSFFGRNWKRKN